MMIWDTSAVLNALYGGLLLGFAVSFLYIFNGKLAGISGILGEALSTKLSGQGWRYAFLFGLVLSPIIYGFFLPLPIIKITASNPAIIVAGLLVGIGTRMANGCTSGHGVCGMARFSPRSIIATLVFMGFGILTVLMLRHML